MLSKLEYWLLRITLYEWVPIYALYRSLRCEDVTFDSVIEALVTLFNLGYLDCIMEWDENDRVTELSKDELLEYYGGGLSKQEVRTCPYIPTHFFRATPKGLDECDGDIYGDRYPRTCDATGLLPDPFPDPPEVHRIREERRKQDELGIKEPLPGKEEQIEAIVHDRARDLVLRYAWRDRSGRPRYPQVFTVSRKEVEQYVKEHYSLDTLPFVHSAPGREDDIHIIPVPDGYRVYYQEGGIHRDEEVVPSEDDAWNFYLRCVLAVSSTGLKW